MPWLRGKPWLAVAKSGGRANTERAREGLPSSVNAAERARFMGNLLIRFPEGVGRISYKCAAVTKVPTSNQVVRRVGRSVISEANQDQFVKYSFTHPALSQAASACYPPAADARLHRSDYTAVETCNDDRIPYDKSPPAEHRTTMVDPGTGCETLCLPISPSGSGN